MAWFEGTHSESRQLDVDPTTAREHFADLDTIVAATKGVASAEIDGRTIHFVLEEEDHGVVKFQGDFHCTYTLEGDTLRWATREGNLQQSGEARFTPAGDGVTLDYTETVKVELGVPAMMAPMLKPVLAAVLAKEVKEYLGRMVTRLEQAPT
ncbi:MAG TPA: hypothetical protein ENK18_27285 [Deltaproteobacteria bacterium]|nr:hypothetical protein [Deltaproteobacteria bacterium]